MRAIDFPVASFLPPFLAVALRSAEPAAALCSPATRTTHNNACARAASDALVCILHTAGKDIEKACQGIYPLQNTFVRKVKVLRSPKFDVTKLMEVHGDYSEEVGAVSFHSHLRPTCLEYVRE